MKVDILKGPYNNSDKESYTSGRGDSSVDTVLECICGNNSFKIYQGHYLTVSKCTSCGLETAVHEG